MQRSGSGVAAERGAVWAVRLRLAEMCFDGVGEEGFGAEPRRTTSAPPLQGKGTPTAAVGHNSDKSQMRIIRGSVFSRAVRFISSE